MYQYSVAADPDLAVGTDRIVVVTNGGVEIWDRAFTPIFRTETNLRKGFNDQNIAGGPPEPVPGFMEATVSADTTGGPPTTSFIPDPLTGSRIFDPRAYWDANSERFFVVAGEHTSAQDLQTSSKIIGRLRIAVSKTSTPNTFDSTDWHFFNFDMFTDIDASAVGVPDFSRTWIGDDHLYVMFRDVDFLNPSPFVSTVAVAIHKSSLLTGTTPTLPVPAVRILNRDGVDCDNDPLTPLPDCVETVAQTNLHGTGRTYGLAGNSPAYSLATDTFPDAAGVRENLVLGALTLSGGILTYTSVLVPIPSGLEFAPIDLGTSVPTPAVGESFGVTAPNFHHAVYRNGSLWATLHGRPVIDDGTGTGTLIPDPNDNRFVVYWYEIDPDGFPAPGSNPTILQAGVIDPTVYQQDLLGAWAVDPSIAVNSQNTATITMHVTSPTKHPSIFRATRYQTQPAGTFPIFNEVVTGTTVLHEVPGTQPVRPMKADYTGTAPDPTNLCLFWGHGMVGGPDDMLMPLDPDRTDRYQTYLTRYALCNFQQSFADVNGDGEVAMDDYTEFMDLFRAGDRRGDANADGFHDAHDLLMMSDEMAARGVR